jgi:hypothetical protein
MPYDDAGNFYYPLPGRKSKSKIAKPLPTTSPGTSVAVVSPPVVEKPLPKVTVETAPPVAVIDKSTSKITVEAEPPGDWHLQPPENRLLTIHEGNNRWQISELDLALIWNAQRWQPGFTLATSDGAAVEVVYRGRWSGGFGPDFKGAIVRVGNRLLRGDIELHLRSGDWRLHGHHQDPRYNNVVLQFALEDNSFPCEQTHAGAELPVIALLPLFKLANISLQEALADVKGNGTRLGSISESTEPCCNRIAERHPDLPELLRQLDKLGEQRFEERAGRYEAAATLDPDDGDQAATESLWSGLLEALGYSQNKTPFKKLAEALPFATVVNFDREARQRRESSEERLLNMEALLLGAAGLLPSQRNLRPVKKTHAHVHDAKTDYVAPDADDSKIDFIAANYTDELERRWDLLRRGLDNGGALLREKDWTFARLRPPNHPARRIAGLARLIVRLSLDEPADFLEELAEIMELEPSDACKAFNEFCRVALAATDSDSGLFWARRYDFADRAILADMRAKGATADLIGADRAADMTVNVFLPFCAAYGRDRYRASLAKAALAAYYAHPRLSSNELVESMAKQVFQKWLGQPDSDGKPYTVNRLITGACRQQGLIYLQRTFCAEQNFAACPLS